MPIILVVIGHVRRDRAQDVALVAVAVKLAFAHEAEVIDVQAVRQRLAASQRRHDLRPVGEGVAPERRPPARVEFVERAVLRLEPLAEAGGAGLAVADAAVLVADVPEQQRRMILVAFGEGARHLAAQAAVVCRVGAVVDALPVLDGGCRARRSGARAGRLPTSTRVERRSASPEWRGCRWRASRRGFRRATRR